MTTRSRRALRMPEPTTLDGLLNGRLKVEQPTRGFRIAVDTLLVAAAVRASPHERIVDLGCGVGGALLALAARVSGLHGVGFDLQADLIALARANARRNALPSRLSFWRADVTRLGARGQGLFDHAMANPPYHAEETHPASPHESKRRANTAPLDDLGLWIQAAARLLQPGGTFTLIHRADRESSLLGLLAQFGFDRPCLTRIVTKEGLAPRRILVRAEKIRHNATPSRANASDATQTLILNDAQGRPTPSSCVLFREGRGLDDAS